MTANSSRPPANVTEFNVIVGLVFAQLYEQFPVPVGHLHEGAIGVAMGAAASSEWSAHALPSGRPLGEVLLHSVKWLSEEGYVRSGGLTPYEQVTLTEKGLAALNSVPQGLSATVGSSLVKATSGSERNLSGIGDLVGGMIGGLAKSVLGS
jgi:hypothetical protein